MAAFAGTGEPSEVSTDEVVEKIGTFTAGVQKVLVSTVAVVGICAGIKIVIKHLPSIDDEHSKNQMWRGLGQVLIGVGAAVALIWIVPWVYGLLKSA